MKAAVKDKERTMRCVGIVVRRCPGEDVLSKGERRLGEDKETDSEGEGKVLEKYHKKRRRKTKTNKKHKETRENFKITQVLQDTYVNLIITQ